MLPATATTDPSASCHCVQSDCQHSLGRVKQNRFVADFGRFCGCGVIRPWRIKIRQIVDRDGTASRPSRRNAHRIDCGP
jgi:hypothetical protein